MAIPRISTRMRRDHNPAADLAGVIRTLADPSVPLEDAAPASVLAATHEGAARLNLRGDWDAAASIPLGLAMARDLTAAGAPGVVGKDRMDAHASLRGFSVTVDAGLRVVTVASSATDPGVPFVSGAPVAGWVATEGADVPASDAVFGLIQPEYRRVGFSFYVSWRLLKQGGATFATLVDTEMRQAIGRAIDAAALGGTGTGGQPQGIAGTAGVNTATGASLAHAALLKMRKDAVLGSAREDALRWVGTPAVQELMAARERAAGSGRFLWDDGSVLGRPAFATAAAPTATLIAGDFSQATLYVYDAIDVIVDRRYLATGGKVRVVVSMYCDVAIAHAAAFSVASSIT